MIERMVTSSVLILGVCLLRLLFRGRISPTVQYAMWGIPAARMMLPFFFPFSQWIENLKSPFSIMNAAGRLHEQVIGGSGMEPLVDNVMTGRVRTYSNPQTLPQKLSGIDWQLVILAVWLAGSILLLAWMLWVNVRFASRLRRERSRYQGSTYGITRLPVYTAPDLSSPCLLMYLGEQAVYLPEDLKAGPDQLRHILAHENCHARHGDPVWGCLRCILLCVFWVNPLVWMAAWLSKRDCELACDEAAIRQLGEEERFEYGRTLIGLTAGRQTATELFGISADLGYGSGVMKARIKMLASHPRMTAVTAALVMAAAAVLVACTYTGKIENGVQKRTEQWAEHFCDRDGEALAAMYTPDDPEGFYRMEPVMSEDGEYAGFGWSSPWPVDHRYEITVDGSRSQITYYALTSDPHLWVWKETLDWDEVAGIYYVAGETLSAYDTVTDAGTFMAAYSQGIEGTSLDYRTNGLGEILNENAAKSPQQSSYRLLYEPGTAGPFLLNLEGGQAAVKTEGEKSEVEYRFEDGSSVLLHMARPFGEDGIWIPSGWSAGESKAVPEDRRHETENGPEGRQPSSQPNQGQPDQSQPNQGQSDQGSSESGLSGLESSELDLAAEQVIRRFAEAYLSSDAEGMAPLFAAEAGKTPEPYPEDIWEQLDTFRIKGGAGGAEGQDELEAQCEFKTAAEDSYTYLGMKLVRDEDSWLVSDFYLEK